MLGTTVIKHLKSTQWICIIILVKMCPDTS